MAVTGFQLLDDHARFRRSETLKHVAVVDSVQNESLSRPFLPFPSSTSYFFLAKVI